MRGKDQQISSVYGGRLKRAVDYIEQNIDHRISLSAVANHAAVSAYHLHRLFRTRFGVPLMDYVRRRKLTHAADRLVRTREPIIAIALEAGFESQAAFTRAFRRVFYTTPAAYRDQGRHIPWLSVAALSEETLATLPELGNGPPRRETRGAFQVVGLEAELSGEERAQIPALWEQLARTAGWRVFSEAYRYGISDGSPDVLQGRLRYLAALGITEKELAPQGLKARSVPAGDYVVIPFRGSPERFPAAIDFLFGTWLPGSGFVRRLAPSFERYPPGFVLRERCEFEFWIPVE